ncbi:MAG: hypothetical protein ACI8QD_001390 [Cyclobacteriaceae bacterium]|jgi:hypothetical protein
MRLKKYSLLLLLSVFVVFACTDESLVPEPVPETAVHGFIQRSTDVENFLYQNTGDVLSFDFQWISIDRKNTVERVEFFISFTEEYTDWEGGSKIANHGSVPFLTLDGASVPANRTTTALGISQADVYALFSSATFAYDTLEVGDDPVQNVFGNPLKPNREATTQPFVDGDSFSLSWILYTADGRKFDTWNDSICLEFPGANCSFNWAVICSQVIPPVAGNFIIDGQDSYGDGWNDGGVNMVIDGVSTFYTFTTGASDSWTIPTTGAESEIYFEFVSGDWDSEITYQITYPDGTEIASWGPSPPSGRVVVNLCSL